MFILSHTALLCRMGMPKVLDCPSQACAGARGLLHIRHVHVRPFDRHLDFLKSGFGGRVICLRSIAVSPSSFHSRIKQRAKSAGGHVHWQERSIRIHQICAQRGPQWPRGAAYCISCGSLSSSHLALCCCQGRTPLGIYQWPGRCYPRESTGLGLHVGCHDHGISVNSPLILMSQQADPCLACMTVNIDDLVHSVYTWWPCIHIFNPGFSLALFLLGLGGTSGSHLTNLPTAQQHCVIWPHLIEQMRS